MATWTVMNDYKHETLGSASGDTKEEALKDWVKRHPEWDGVEYQLQVTYGAPLKY